MADKWGWDRPDTQAAYDEMIEALDRFEDINRAVDARRDATTAKPPKRSSSKTTGFT